MYSNPRHAELQIPGTTVFTLTRARQGYHLNMFCLSLQSAANRAAFKQDESAFLDGFTLSAEQRAAIQARDYNRMLALGGNIYYLSRIAAADGESFQQIASRMTGIPLEEYQRQMLAGGRSGVDPQGDHKHG